MDKLELHGRLTLTTYLKGIKQKTVCGNNLIVASGYLALLQGLSGIANKTISKVQIGTNSNTPVSSNTVITNAVDIVITSKVATSTELIIKFAIGANTGNESTFQEFGLILADGTLFSRKSWPAINKIQDLTIEGTWVITI